MSHPTNPVPEAMYLAGDYILVRLALVREVGVNGAILLELIHHRQKLSRYIDGYPATLAELAEETGLTVKQVKTALEKLRDEGRLVSRRGDGWNPTLTWQVHGGTSREVQKVLHEKDERYFSSPSIKNKEEQPREDAVLDAFEAAWKRWPRKVGKSTALKSWRKAVRKAEVSTIAAAISSVADIYATWPRDRLAYIPHLATWLNQERWNDEEKPTPFRNGHEALQPSRVYDSDMEPYEGDPDDVEAWNAHRESERQRIWRERGEL